MKLTILSPDKEIFDGEVTSVKVPGSAGSFELLNNHAPIVSSLNPGVVRVKTAKETFSFEVDKGFIEMLNNEISLLVQGYAPIKGDG
ncbi:MAG: ATP synthase F1 subunit epsilon [Saprospirales bacterium]|nr:MAG: ATP synthase F1 subunit epsilon [Saprospirales bacterium]